MNEQPIGRVTMATVAQVAGVSIASVSNAMNGRTGLTDEVRSRILAVADGLGYRKNTLAQELRNGRSRTIGLSVVDLSNPFYADLSQGVIKTAARLGYDVFLSNVGPESESLNEAVSGFMDRRLGGMLFTSLRNADAELLRNLQQLCIPFVKLVRDVQGVNADWVGIDDYSGGVALASHVATLGRNVIACLGGPSDSNASSARVNGLRLGLAKHGAEIINEAQSNLHGAPTRSSGYERAMQVIQEFPGVQCIIGGNDVIAIGIFDACRDSGLEVPEDIAVAGFDNMSFSSVGPFQLTTVDVPREQIGAIGAQYLIERMEGFDGAPRRECLPHHVVRRSSTSPILT
jgi:LacI family transcriptional regulator